MTADGFPGAIYPDQKIAELVAEVARLRAALTRIADGASGDEGAIAITALGEWPSGVGS